MNSDIHKMNCDERKGRLWAASRSRKARGDALRAPGCPGADNVSDLIEISVDIVVSMPHMRKMRDDRYQGTSLPRPVRKLCLMAEREADRVRPDRLREQAVAAFISEATREISPEFRERSRRRCQSYRRHGGIRASSGLAGRRVGSPARGAADQSGRSQGGAN